MYNKQCLAVTICLLIIFQSCNDQPEKNLNSSNINSQNPSLEQRKSSAKFIIISEIHEPIIKSSGNPNPGRKNWYTIYVENFNDTDENIWTDMSNEAKSKSYDKNGFTVVFFFSDKANTPSINNGLDWNEKYDKYCVGGYWHYPNGDQEIKRYPMK